MYLCVKKIGVMLNNVWDRKRQEYNKHLYTYFFAKNSSVVNNLKWLNYEKFSKYNEIEKYSLHHLSNCHSYILHKELKNN